MSWIFRALLAAGVAFTAANAEADTIVETRLAASSASFINEYDNALAPLQFVKFCMNYRAECEQEDAGQPALPSGEIARNVLSEVNRAVNDAITPTRKSTNPMLAHWSVSPDAGDCNDYAVTKRHTLIALGWPKSALRLAVVLTEGGQGHLVLIVRTSDGDVVLDNLTSSVRPWRTMGYQWISMQSGSNPRFWVAIGENGAHLRANRLASGRSPS